MSISEARAASYEYVPPVSSGYEENKATLSIIVDCYYRLDLVRQSIQSVLDQDYPNVELILIDNGAQPEVRRHLAAVHASSRNTTLIRFAENQFSWDDVERTAAVCWNAGLLHATGDFVCHLGYDDMLSPDYARRMVRLFTDNPDCVTAAPMPFSINAAGDISSDHYLRERNLRGRYTDGCSLAFDMIEGSPRKLFAAPGEIFVIRRDLLLQHGGYDRIIDLSQVLKYAIFGASGFDPDAELYWRHHEGQLNRLAVRRGAICYASSAKAWSDSGIVEVWRQRFDASKVNALLAFRERTLAAIPLIVVGLNMRGGNPGGVAAALWNMAKECPALLPRGIYAVAREILSMLIGGAYRRLRVRA